MNEKTLEDDKNVEVFDMRESKNSIKVTHREKTKMNLLVNSKPVDPDLDNIDLELSKVGMNTAQ